MYDRVVAASAQLFDQGGYFALTVDALVVLSGVSKKTVYRWWNNRAEVALDVIGEVYGPPPGVPGDGSALDRLLSYVVAEARYVGGPAGPVLAGLLADCQQRPAQLATVRDRFLAGPRSTVRALVADAVDEGVIAADSDLDVVTSMLLDPIYHALLTGEGPAGPDAAAARIRHLLVGVRRES
ncbi:MULTISPECIES: TetR/AcrR family transcriptional regulator [Pseudonocardia]|uniref:TetR/AcrR family transcriptional regulator n=1 Tax=Pseudonocardia TaxID=1847 RepID=UPI000F768A5B|nr:MULTISPECIES: TetR/AcrR family transcriptional regulator [Pseudonocardia]